MKAAKIPTKIITIPMQFYRGKKEFLSSRDEKLPRKPLRKLL